MKRTKQIFLISLFSVFSVSLSALCLGQYFGKNFNGAKADPTPYTIELNSTNSSSSLPSGGASAKATETYRPSRLVDWYYSGPAYAPAGAHIGFDYTTLLSPNGIHDFWLNGVNGNTNNGIKGIQTLSLNYTITGSINTAYLAYHNTRAPAQGTEGAVIIDLKGSSSLELTAEYFTAFQSNFFLRIRLFTSSAESKFVINSLIITYTCQ